MGRLRLQAARSRSWFFRRLLLRSSASSKRPSKRQGKHSSPSSSALSSDDLASPAQLPQVICHGMPVPSSAQDLPWSIAASPVPPEVTLIKEGVESRRTDERSSPPKKARDRTTLASQRALVLRLLDAKWPELVPRVEEWLQRASTSNLADCLSYVRKMLQPPSSESKQAAKRATKPDALCSTQPTKSTAAPVRESKPPANVPCGTCDRCDGAHLSQSCPVYKKPRDSHPDAQRGVGRSLGGSGGNYFLPSARVVRQPGDGSCLFHSMSHGLRHAGGARSLRRELAQWIERNPSYKISETPLSDWIRWDSNCSVAQYAKRMGQGMVWGGGIEMAACTVVHRVNVHVYEKRGSGFKRISCFDTTSAKGTVNVLYGGRMHYDAIEPASGLVQLKSTMKPAQTIAKGSGAYYRQQDKNYVRHQHHQRSRTSSWQPQRHRFTRC